MSTAEEIVRTATSVLIIDWPSREVPEALARAGLVTVVAGGPVRDNYSAYQVYSDEISVRHVDRPPDHVDVVYAYRPLVELTEIVAVARDLDATAVWIQSGLAADGTKEPSGCWMPKEWSRDARGVVESAGLVYIDSPYIADAVRARDRCARSTGMALPPKMNDAPRPRIRPNGGGQDDRR